MFTYFFHSHEQHSDRPSPNQQSTSCTSIRSHKLLELWGHAGKWAANSREPAQSKVSFHSLAMSGCSCGPSSHGAPTCHGCSCSGFPTSACPKVRWFTFNLATRWKVILGKVPCYRFPFWRWSRQVGINSSRRNPALSLSSIFCVKLLLHDDFKAGPPARLPKVLHHGRQLVYHPRQPGADLGSTSGKECFSQLDKNQSRVYKLAS